MARKIWEGLSGSQLTFWVNFITAFGIFFEGWNQGNMGFANASPDYQVRPQDSPAQRLDEADRFAKRIMGLGTGDGVVTRPLKEGGIVAIYYLGATIGGLWGGHVADKYGRVKGVLFGCLWVVMGGSLMVSQPSLSSVCLGRLTHSPGLCHERCLDVLLACHCWSGCRLFHYNHPCMECRGLECRTSW